MGLEAWFTICVLILVIAALVSNRMGMDIALLSGLIILMVVGVVDVHDVAAGFASEAVLMIAGLYVFAAGMQETGAFSEVARKLLGRPSSVMGAQFRLMAPVALMSGFMNNTPIVAMCIPLVKDWAKTQPPGDRAFPRLHCNQTRTGGPWQRYRFHNTTGVGPVLRCCRHRPALCHPRYRLDHVLLTVAASKADAR